MIDAYFGAIWVSTLVNIGVACGLWFLLGKEKACHDHCEKLPTLKESFDVLKLAVIWIISIILFCTYTLHVGMTFFTPYLTSSFGLSDDASGSLTLIRSYVFMSFIPITGLITDRLFKSTLKWFLVVCPVVALILFAVILLGADRDFSSIEIGLSMLVAFFVCSIYASMFSILSECQIPIAVAGTAIGLVSIFSYTPDTIMLPLFGYFADTNQYHFIFLSLIIMALLSGLLSLILLAMKRKNQVKSHG
ncbi:hypothetical protein RHO15_10290 [Utexia brackfieldae]|uniref:hypothetical protein n=1 Tax=Utexia brackfieldae TaxID=3074108 RepID=UPI00370D5C71